MPIEEKTFEKPLELDQMFVNMGPQHPSTHGVLRIALHMEGEVITKAEPDVGYLHRGIEKLFENRTYTQGLVLTDRLDYLSSMHNNLAYCIAVEKLMGIEVPARAQYIRALVSELNRIASHLIFFGTYGVDIGAFTPFLHAFREREMIMDLFEMLCGARLLYTYMRIGGVAKNLPEDWTAKCREFTGFFPKRLKEYDALLSFNPIFMDRTANIGIISKEEALDWGLSGPVLRATGVNYDVRKFEPYSFYDKLEFEIPLGQTGSTWDRYYCRMREMAQSAGIIDQCLEALSKQDMPPDIIAKGVPKILKPLKGQAYGHIEASRGDLGFYAVSEGEFSPYRMHIKAPTFINTAILQKILVGAKIADVVAILGSFDIVLGEMDR
ncbi:MAG: NADH-quinone oxidoreductase subunit D [Elusimicrobia bacterium]|nr:NADH-quinone oxidoreductase subunit D [Elusimicrobiota bacterium]